MLAMLLGGMSAQGQVRVDGDVYGGGNLADVGTNASDSTRVYILSGTVTGSVYGGGRGQADPLVEPLVKGGVHVYIGQKEEGTGDISGSATIRGYVFGCNNIAGTPRNNVKVDVWKTAHTSGTPNNLVGTFDDFETFKTTVSPSASVWHTNTAFAIQAVYGGGNEAAYVPAVTNRYSTTVFIHNCENTVKMVYGGGRAADVGMVSGSDTIKANVYVTIEGGRIDTLFGGGDGHTLTNPAAPWDENTNPYRAANIYGNATSTIEGGYFTAAFAGSNTAGDILGGIKSLTVLKTGPCSDGTGDDDQEEYIISLFGGSNEAATHGNVELTVGCGVDYVDELYGGSNKAEIINGDVTLNVYGGTFEAVYGGSKGTAEKAANITGNVNLNIYGGTITDAFGGSNINGNITGLITVNVFDLEGSCKLDITNIYGGGNETAYTPNKITVSGAQVNPTSPRVNIIHVAHADAVQDGPTEILGIRGSVYGGAKGGTATVTSNPRVVIGAAANRTPGGDTLSLLTSYPHPYVVGNVYGGGNAAAVAGSATVQFALDVSHATDVFGGGNVAPVSDLATVDVINGTATRLFGGGNQANVGSSSVRMNGGTVEKVYGGGNDVSSGGVTGDVSVYVNNGASTTSTITGGLYGGCNTNGTVGGAITVTINGGTIGTDDLNYEDGVYGGGYGPSTATSDDVTVTIGSPSIANEPAIYGDVYGGSAKGGINAADKNTVVTLNKGTIHGDLYGGGLGDGSHAAQVNGAVQVNVNGGTVENVFGCNNANGAPQSTVAVNVTAGTVNHDVYGGGNNAAYSAPVGTPDYPVVTITGTGVVSGNVFGGGYGSTATVTGNPAVFLRQGASITGNVYGGGNNGAVNGNSSVTIQDE